MEVSQRVKTGVKRAWWPKFNLHNPYKKLDTVVHICKSGLLLGGRKQRQGNLLEVWESATLKYAPWHKPQNGARLSELKDGNRLLKDVFRSEHEDTQTHTHTLHTPTLTDTHTLTYLHSFTHTLHTPTLTHIHTLMQLIYTLTHSFTHTDTHSFTHSHSHTHTSPILLQWWILADV